MKQVLFSMLLLIQLNAQAFTSISVRCGDDNLDVAQAENRMKWALKCYPFLEYLTQEGKMLHKDAQTGNVHLGYPIFAEKLADETLVNVVAPIDPDAECWDTNRYHYVGSCVAGCFTPDQNILMNSATGHVEIKTAMDKQYNDIFLIDGINQSGSLEFKTKKITGYTADLEDRYQPVLIFKTQSGGELKVTPNHPLVNGQGYMVEASTLVVGDSLKTIENKNDKIVSVEKINYFGKVYNIDTGSTDIYDNIILANDFLSGTVYFQNDGVVHLNRLVLRNVGIIPDSLLE